MGSTEKVWYAIWYGRALNYAISFLLVFVAIKYKNKLKHVPHLHRLIYFTFIFYSVANVATSVPSGGRFISLAKMLSIFGISLFYQNHFRNSLSNIWLPMATPAFLLFVIVSIRVGLYYISVTTLIGNPIIAIFNTGNFMAIIDIIKSL
jgi:hypothetical protein